MMIRFFDILLSLIGLVLTFPIFITLWFLNLSSEGSVFFFQERVGKDKVIFTLVKFRTMKKGTASKASHLVSSSSITPIGRFLRKVKVDELPQLWNVLTGEMSFVGPRPNLPNQHKLIKARDVLGIYKVKPGITGFSQINGVDMSTPELLAQTDSKMISNMSLANYLKYIFLTATGRGLGDRVSRH